MSGTSSAAIAVVFAGGVGSRMKNAEQPKQFLPVEGKPILVHTLEHFQRHQGVGGIYIATLTDYIDVVWAMVHDFGVGKVRRIVEGGRTAQESIANGLRSALADGAPDDAIALIHDGVRPLINRELITANIRTAREHGNGITAIPCFETIARSTDGAGTIESVTKRHEMHILQAPQTFRLGPLARTNERSARDGLLGTFVDQAELMRYYGEELHLVPGFRGNVKITTDLDFLQYQILAASGHLAAVIGGGSVRSSVIDEDTRSILDLPVPWQRLSGARVLVTGATGMVGQTVTRALLGLAARVTPAPRVIALVQNEAKALHVFADDLGRGSLRLIVQDVADPFPTDLDVDWVVHAASPANPASFRDDPVRVIRANVLGTMHSLELARSTASGVCLISTLEVYGAATGRGEHGTGLLDEHTPGILDSLDPRSAYPESKRLAETLCVAHHQQFGTPYRIARLSHTYGPGMAVDDARVQAYFLRQALSGADIVLQSDGTLRRTYTYISDAAAAVLCLLLSEDNDAFNIANDDARVSIRELAEAFQRHSPVGGGSVLTKPRTDTGLWSSSPGGTFLDCGRLLGTGWIPRISIDAGVARTIRHEVETG